MDVTQHSLNHMGGVLDQHSGPRHSGTFSKPGEGAMNCARRVGGIMGGGKKIAAGDIEVMRKTQVTDCGANASSSGPSKVSIPIIVEVAPEGRTVTASPTRTTP